MADETASWRSALTLTLIASGCAGLVAAVFAVAEPRIDANREHQRVQRYAAVLGDVDTIDADPIALPVSGDGELTALSVRGAYRSSQLTAFVLEAATVGYSGPIRLIIATDPTGRVLGVRVLTHDETPGIGDFIEARRSSWIDGFRRRSLGDPPTEAWAIASDGGAFDAVTGATVTARAVVQAVREALERLAAESGLAERLAARRAP